MKKLIYITLYLGIFFVSCSNEEVSIQKNSDKIELSFSINDFVREGITTRATSPASEVEKQVDNLYAFLFDPADVKLPIKYYTGDAVGGSWSETEKKVTINQKQSDVGNRNVYVVANCADIKTELDGVTTVAGLQSVLRTTGQPWSSNIATPLLLVGNRTYDFNTGYQLNNIPLERAVAKLQLNITLKTAAHQSAPTVNGDAQYKYKYVGFDQRTYVVKPVTKPDYPVSSGRIDWLPAGQTIEDGVVRGLSLTTYLNERDAAGATVEVSLPYNGGFLPPPEFGDDTYRLVLPQQIVRNTWYVYDIEI